MTYTTKQTQFLETAIKVHGEGAILPKAVLAEVAEEAGTGFPYWLTNPKLMGSLTKVSKGMYKIPSLSGEEVVPVIAVTEEKTTVKESEKLEHISYRFYNTPEYWWVIAKANNISNGSIFLEPGKQLRIPNITSISGILTSMEELNSLY